MPGDAAEPGVRHGLRFGGQRYGACYERGLGFAKDEKKAVEWYTKAVEAGNTIAAVELAGHYLHGHGVTKDPKKALELLQKASSDVLYRIALICFAVAGLCEAGRTGLAEAGYSQQSTQLGISTPQQSSDT